MQNVRFLLLVGFLAVSFVSTALAQTPVKIWDKRFGGAYGEGIRSIVAAPGGGYVAAGYSASDDSGDITETSRGGNDFWLVKIDENGNKVWDKRFGGNNDDICNTIIVAPGGGYVAAGNSSSDANGDKTETSQGSTDFWLVKIDENGNKVWDKRFGGNLNEECFSIVAAPGGGYLAAGFSDSDVNGDKTETSQGYEDFWLVKVDENGNKIWDKRFGGIFNDICSSIIVAESGNYLAAGYSNSEAGGDKTESNQGADDFWLVKIDSNGNKIWDKRYGGAQDDLLHSIVAAQGGGFIAAGTSGSDATGDKTEPTRGQYDFWLVRIDENGIKIWDKRFGGTLYDECASIVAAPSGGYLATGNSESGSNGDKTEPTQGQHDYWLVKIDENGNKIWDKRFGGGTYDYCRSIIAAPGGGYMAAGDSYSGADGDKSEPSQGSYDTWFVKFTDKCPNPPIFTLASNAPNGLCPNNPVTLSAVSDSNYTYVWQPGGATGEELIVPNLTETTTYTVTATNTSGCSAMQTIEVYVITPSQFDTLTINFGDTLTLNAGEGLSYHWLPTGENTNTIEITEPGLYSVSVSNGICSYIKSFVVDTGVVNAGVSGKVFFDLNENGQYDAGETPSVNRPVFLLQPSGAWVSTTSTDSTGFYWAPWPAAGSYRVKVQQPNISFISTVPNAIGEYNETIASIAEAKTNRDFGFRDLKDVRVSITPSFLRPGFPYTLKVEYCNNSPLTTFDGNVTIAIDSLLNYTGQTVFPYSSFQPNECRSFNITGTVPANIGLGVPITCTAEITPLNDDAPANNTDSFTENTRASYDPNDKTAYVSGRANGDFALETETIDYLIRFQNTGTDTAFTVVVRDTLDFQNLDLTTFEYVTASHPALFTIREKGIAVWQFNNILLPDSGTNEPASHGFIRFRAKPKSGSACNSKTDNRVSIFFDFNDPVFTNQAETVINPTPQGAINVSGIGFNAVFTANIAPFAEEYVWNFGADATPQTATGAGPHNVVYSTEGKKNASLAVANRSVCKTTLPLVLTIEKDSLITSRATAREFGFNLYPNPSQGRFNLEYDSQYNDAVRIEVVDANGRVVVSESRKTLVGKNVFSLNLSDSPKGVYVVRLIACYQMATRLIQVD